MFKPNWKIALFTTALLPLLLMLGFWQLDREQEKIALQAEYARRTIDAPISLAEVDTQADNAFVRVQATGRYDNQRIFLLDNRVHEGIVGYEVIQLFDAGATQALINRGWVPHGGRRDILPVVPLVEGVTEITGSIHIPEGRQFMLAETSLTADWPQVIQSIDIPQMASVLDETAVFPHIIRLADDSPGVLQPNWPLVNMAPETHRAYAVQWFVMAAVLLMLFLYTSFHRDRDGARERKPD